MDSKCKKNIQIVFVFKSYAPYRYKAMYFCTSKYIGE